jgi:rhamnogalacturonyl hydrolase YesR
LTRFRARVLSHDPASYTTGWEDVLVPHGVALAGEAFHDEELIDWAVRWFEHHDAAGYQENPRGGGIVTFSGVNGFDIGDYCGNWGGPMVFSALHRVRPTPRYVSATERICEALLRQVIRFPDGTFAHGGFEEGRRTIWVDTLYYASGVLSAGYQLTGNKSYAEEAVRQARLHSKWLRDPQTGGWFHDVDPATGVRTPSFWARGNGWIVLGLADTLRLCPSDTPGWNDVLADYRSLVTCLLRLQHPCGMWRIVPENECAHLETSGTAMILVGITQGIAAGWIDQPIKLSLMRAFHELLTWIDPYDGAFQGAQRPAGSGNWETHKRAGMGECTYATGMMWRLLGDLRAAGFIGANALGQL